MLVCRVLGKDTVNKSELRQAVVEAFTTTNRLFLERAEQEGWIDGTTAVVALGIGEGTASIRPFAISNPPPQSHDAQRLCSRLLRDVQAGERVLPTNPTYTLEVENRLFSRN